MRRPIMVQQKALMRRREVAEILDVSVTTLKKWHDEGYGPPRLRVGRRCVRYRREDVLTFIHDLQRT